MKRIIALFAAIFFIILLISCSVQEENSDGSEAASAFASAESVELEASPESDESEESYTEESDVVSSDESVPEKTDRYYLSKSFVHDFEGVLTKTSYVFGSDGTLIGEYKSGGNQPFTSIEYYYSKEGQLIKKTVVVVGAYITETTYEYDDNNNQVLEEVRTRSAPGGPEVKETVRRAEKTYDDENRFVSASIYLDEKLEMTSHVSYNEKNESMNEEVYIVDEQGNPELFARAESDASGRALRLESTENTVEYEYDEYNNKKVVKITPANGEPCEYVYENEYDEHGNLVKANCVCKKRGLEFTDEYEYEKEYW